MERTTRLLLLLSAPLGLLAAIAAGAGVLDDSLYQHDRDHFAAQAIGQDHVTLLVAVPTMLVLAALAWRGSRASLLLWHGSVFYLVYTYAVAAFMVQFNSLFLVYTTILGLGTLMLASSLARTMSATTRAAFGSRWPRRSIAALLLTIVVVFSFLWLSDIVPALITGETPDSLSESGTPTNGVEVIDLALLLPTAALTALWVLKQRAPGNILAMAYLSFTALLSLALIGMVVALVSEGLADSAAPAAIFGALGAASAALAIASARSTLRFAAPEMAAP